LIQLLTEARRQSADELKETIFNAAGEFCSNTFRDDAALMVIALG